jgi:ubiquitin-activating enzyme E1-like protein
VSPARLRSGANALHQRGFALIAVLVLAAMITAYLITMGLNRSRAEISNNREDHDMQALRQAKAALIAYAASEQWQRYKGQAPDQPGGLPCPDLTNSGSSFGCSSASQRVGRLPYLTIGSEDLSDTSGERLWYAVSSTFYKGNNVINSDTKGLLTVTGTAAANNAVAIVFAPGQAVQDSTLPGQVQDRTGANVNRTASYLEGYVAAGADYTYASTPLPTNTFDDRLLAITQADLMATVEPVVAARIKRTVAPLLISYKTDWKAFPYPARFDNPDPGTGASGTSPRSPMTYIGDPSRTFGLLPVAHVAVSAASNATPIVVTTDMQHGLSGGDTVWISDVGGNAAANGTWTVTVLDPTHFRLNGSSGSGGYTSGGIVKRGYLWTGAAITKAPGGSGKIVNGPCSPVSPPSGPFRFQCQFQAQDDIGCAGTCISNLSFQIQAFVDQTAGRTLAVLPNLSGVATTINGANTTLSADSLTGSVASNGAGTVTYKATIPAAFNCAGPCSYALVVTIPDVAPNSAIRFPDANVGWFIGNEWYRQTFYALAPDFVPGGNINCTANPPCLTVNNLPPEYAAPAKKEAILILAGRALNGTPRPSASLNDYLEGKNQNGATTAVYEHRSGVPTSINDRVVVVSP